MIPSRETIERLQAEIAFAPGALEIVLRLLDMLRRVRADIVLGERLALKGGTALDLCFPPVRRLSVDLDFNVQGPAERDAMLRDRPQIVEAVERLARVAGYRTQRSREAHAGQKFYLSYASALGGQGRIGKCSRCSTVRRPETSSTSAVSQRRPASKAVRRMRGGSSSPCPPRWICRSSSTAGAVSIA